MRLWTREAAGWLLLALGLYIFYRSYTLLLGGGNPTPVFEGAILTVIGIFLFRGGIHLLKIAVAARVCMDAQARLETDPEQPGGVPKPSRPPASRRLPPYAGNLR